MRLPRLSFDLCVAERLLERAVGLFEAINQSCDLGEIQHGLEVVVRIANDAFKKLRGDLGNRWNTETRVYFVFNADKIAVPLAVYCNGPVAQGIRTIGGPMLGALNYHSSLISIDPFRHQRPVAKAFGGDAAAFGAGEAFGEGHLFRGGLMIHVGKRAKLCLRLDPRA